MISPRPPRSRLSLSLALALPLFCPTALLADVSLPSLFSEGAVFQQKQPIPVWGTAEAGEAVTVTLAGNEVKTTADASGNWFVKLPSVPAGGPFELSVKGNNVVVVPDVAIGEVWLASGQSNMAFRLQVPGAPDSPYVVEAEKEIQAANDPMLRMLTVRKKATTEPVDKMVSLEGTWTAASPEAAGRFSAVAYHFAKELRRKLKVPVGIIHSSWGGTPAQAWTNLAALEAEPTLAHYGPMRLNYIEQFPEAEKIYKEVTLAQWQTKVDAAKAAGKNPPRQPRPPIGPESSQLPGSLYNAMIHPLIPYGIRGVIWYQGEANASKGKEYRTLFPALIKNWRSEWKQGDFPFLFVQLANYQTPQTEPVEKAPWAMLREAQLMTLAVPHTGMASAIDLADPEKPGDIHPHNKKDVGLRLALNALAKVYDQPVASYSGPIFSSMKTEGNKVRLSFEHADGGLQAKGEKLLGFAIASKEGAFVWADAVIEGDTVVVSSEQVKEPARVRYGWATNPIGNLYNKEGLPASPFRTDTEADE